jgi:hypothetical protein
LDFYPPESTVAAARQTYFDRYGLGDGGYEANWVYIKLGSLPVVFPNTPARKRNVRAHDLHHLATGYNAVLSQGEIDVSAFELSCGGCRTFLFGWMVICGLFVLGLVVRPRPLFRAFMRGRGARNLFQTPVGSRYDAMTVAELRRFLGVRDGLRLAGGADVGMFAVWSAISILVTALSATAFTAPIALGVWWIAR